MALVITLKVVPASGKQCCILDTSGSLKCYLKSPPERGFANKELIQFLAKSLKIPQTSLMLIAGDTARKKKIKIEGIASFQELLHLLQIAPQDTQKSLL